jgi:hypothetical protein
MLSTGNAKFNIGNYGFCPHSAFMCLVLLLKTNNGVYMSRIVLNNK